MVLLDARAGGGKMRCALVLLSACAAGELSEWPPSPLLLSKLQPPSLSVDDHTVFSSYTDLAVSSAYAG